MAETIISLKGITKHFPGVLANNSISIDIKRGEVHAIIGENGAGKSTLMNILYGIYHPDQGEIYINGIITRIDSPKAAINKGIGMVHQHFMLVPSLTVVENIVLGSEPRKGVIYDFKEARILTKRLSERFNLKIDPDGIVEDIPVGIQQRIEILKTLYRGAEILILDEPTAVLTPQETEELFKTIKTLKKEGKTIIFITHKLQEVMAVSDRVSVLRRGNLEGTLNTAETNTAQLANLMVGREVLFTVSKEKARPGKVLLKLENVQTMDNRDIQVVKGISLNARAGEILGIAGVEGNGQSELVEALTGLRPITGGKMVFQGTDVTNYNTKQLREAGISYIPADRIKYGLNAYGKIYENAIIGRQDKKPFTTNLFNLNFRKIKDFTLDLIKIYDVRTPDENVTAGSLSGGNMQKLIIAREFSFDSQFLIINQPTRGLDVGAIEFIHEQIIKKRDEGCGIILVSAELDEIFQVADRILVMYEGRINGEFTPDQTNKEEVGYYMLGAEVERGDAVG